MIKSFDTSNLRLVANDLLSAIAEVGKKHGVKFSYKGCNYAESSATFRMFAELEGAEPQSAIDYRTYATSYGLKLGWLNKWFTYGGVEHQIVGLYPRKRRMPVAVKRDDGMMRIFSVELIQKLMK